MPESLLVRAIEFSTPEAEKRLRDIVSEALAPAYESHLERRTYYNKNRDDYDSKPESEVKNFPWPNASNVVVPLVGMFVDAITARLLKAMLGTKDFCEVTINSKNWESVEVPDPTDPTGQATTTLSMEKEIRDWINNFIRVGNTRDRLRTLMFDVALHGDGFVKPIWSDEKRTYHSYNAQGQVIDLPVPEYTGVRWHVPAPDDIIPARGFDEWDRIPFVSNVFYYTWSELLELKATGQYRNIDEPEGNVDPTSLKGRFLKKQDAKERDDPRHVSGTKAQKLGTVGPAQIFEVHELQGKFPIETITVDEAGESQVSTSYEECVITYSLEFDVFLRTIYNPFFGKSRHLVRVPFLVKAHRLYGDGVAEQVRQFQKEASTSHNQVVDSGTAANAAIMVVSPDADLGNKPEIYPGKKIVTDNPDKDVRAIFMGANSSILGATEQQAVRYAEARVGVSPYNLGMESTVVGSRATATGTTALISEGNLRFAMSIDDIRHAIESLLYITIQLEQQMRPGGHEWVEGRFIMFPQGDVRTSIGLALSLTSEKINRDLEIQNLMLLMQVLNEYYMRLMQASALLANPMFPPQHKVVAIQIMEASERIVKRFVERFDIEDVDSIVPGLMDTINAALRTINSIPGLPQGPAALPPGQGGGAPPGGVPPAGGQVPPGGGGI